MKNDPIDFPLDLAATAALLDLAATAALLDTRPEPVDLAEGLTKHRLLALSTLANFGLIEFAPPGFRFARTARGTALLARAKANLEKK